MTAICMLSHRNQPERPRQALPGTRTCRGCYSDMERCLIGEDRFTGNTRTRTPGLAELWRDLQDVLAGGGRSGGAFVTGSKDLPLPIVPVVADHRRDIADILGSWVLQHMAEWPEHGPGSLDVQLTTRWLANRLDKAATQEWVVDYATELRQLRGRAFALLDPVRTARFPVAWCVTPGCQEPLVADIATNDTLLPPVIYCAGCEAEWPPHRWIELGKAVRARQAEQQQEGAA